MNPNFTPKPAEQLDAGSENSWASLGADAPDWQTLTENQDADETARKQDATEIVEKRDTAETTEKHDVVKPTEQPTTAARVAELLGEDWPDQSRLRLSESERRSKADRESLDTALRMFGRAANEELSPDDRFEVELSLDILDEVGEQLDDEENDQNAHDILSDMVEKYDRLAHKAPTPDRRQKYFAMAQIASKQRNHFGDWKAIDEAKKRPKSRAEQALDTSFIV